MQNLTLIWCENSANSSLEFDEKGSFPSYLFEFRNPKVEIHNSVCAGLVAGKTPIYAYMGMSLVFAVKMAPLKKTGSWWEVHLCL